MLLMLLLLLLFLILLLLLQLLLQKPGGAGAGAGTNFALYVAPLTYYPSLRQISLRVPIPSAPRVQAGAYA